MNANVFIVFITTWSWTGTGKLLGVILSDHVFNTFHLSVLPIELVSHIFDFIRVFAIILKLQRCLNIFPAEGRAACQPGSSRAEIGRKRRWGSGKRSSTFCCLPVAGPSPPPPLLLPLIKSHTDLNGLFVPQPLGEKKQRRGEERRGKSGVDRLALWEHFSADRSHQATDLLKEKRSQDEKWVGKWEPKWGTGSRRTWREGSQRNKMVNCSGWFDSFVCKRQKVF